MVFQLLRKYYSSVQYGHTTFIVSRSGPLHQGRSPSYDCFYNTIGCCCTTLATSMRARLTTNKPFSQAVHLFSASLNPQEKIPTGYVDSFALSCHMCTDSPDKANPHST